jgi:glycosyltransferase involved in cell wall biosynthesis
MLEGASLIHVTTDAERELIADVAPGVPRAVVPCGIYVDQFAAAPPTDGFRRRLGGYEGLLIVFLGRITAKKGVDVLIRAVDRARAEVDCRLAVIGPDDEGILPGLRRLTADLGLEDTVDFVAPVYGQERLAALASADVWALSSHTENFGIAVVEAMAAGCAVAISPGVNIAPDVAAAGAGAVAEATPEAFGEALTRLLSDEPGRADLRERAMGFAARYDWSVVAPQLRDMYSRVCASDTD